MKLSKWRHILATLVIVLCTPIAFLRWLLSWIVVGLEFIEDNTWRHVSDWADRRLV